MKWTLVLSPMHYSPIQGIIPIHNQIKESLKEESNRRKLSQNHAIVLSVPAIMLDVHSNNPNLLIKRKLNKTWETKRRMIINKTWDELWMM